MDKFIFKVGDWSCTIFDKVGLEQLKAANCVGYDGEYALGAWSLFWVFLLFFVPAIAKSIRDFFLVRDRKPSQGEKE